MEHQEQQAPQVLWTEEYEKEILDILLGTSEEKETRKYYHVLTKYMVKSLGNVRKVCRKKDGKLMACASNAFSIAKDIHDSGGHKGEKKRMPR